MTDGQKVLLGMAIEPDIAAEAERRRGDRTDLATSGPNGPEVAGYGMTRDQVAEKVGINSGSTYRRHKDLLDQLANEPDGPQLLQHVASGDWDMDDVRGVS